MRRNDIKRLGFILAVPLLLACTQIDPIERDGLELKGVESLTAGYAEVFSPGTSEDTDNNSDKDEVVYTESITSQVHTNRIIVSLGDADDPGLMLLRHPYTKERVEEFYADLTGSRAISASIITWSGNFDIPLSLAFSLSWVESGFSAEAVNSNPSSMDRGLFQLNSRSFPELDETDFFNPDVNAEHGLKYLKRCIDTGGNEIVGLAMYNAGRTRVEKGGTPIMTLEYISKVLEYRENLEQEFEKNVLMKGIVLKKQTVGRSVS